MPLPYFAPKPYVRSNPGNKLRSEKYQVNKNKVIVSIPSLPERELSEYEKIREEQIKQLKKEKLNMKQNGRHNGN